MMEIWPKAEGRPKRESLQRDGGANAQRALLLPRRQFFAASPVACPYVPGRAERKLIVDLEGGGGALFYDDLSRAGFRRSHRFAYRPVCGG